MGRTDETRAVLMSGEAMSRAVRAYLDQGDAPWAWRMLLQGRDHLRLTLARDLDEPLESWLQPPPSTGSPQWDRLIAALVEHEFTTALREPPSWAALDPLPEPFAPTHPFLSEARVVDQTPSWLGRWNIYVPARDLVTA